MPTGIYKRTKFHRLRLSKWAAAYRKRNVIPSFWSRVKKTTYCWLWTGAMRGGSCPYGVIRFKSGRRLAHRLSWEINCGRIPKDKFVLHKCDNPLCIRPSHLWIGTWSDNNKDRMRKGRSAIGPRNGRWKPELH